MLNTINTIFLSTISAKRKNADIMQDKFERITKAKNNLLRNALGALGEFSGAGLGRSGAELPVLRLRKNKLSG